MHPREWRDRWWIAFGILSYPIAYDFGVGSYSLATGVAMLAGATLGAHRAMRVLVLSTPGLGLMAAFGTAGWDDIGYAAGRVLVCWGVARWAAEGRPLQRPREVMPLIGAILAFALVTTLAFVEPTFGLQLKTYYAAVIALSLFISFYYALRLVGHPTRVLGMVAALAPYYALGLAVAVVLRGLDLYGPIAIPSIPFHGFTAHLPADALTAVAACFLTGPKRR